MRPGVRNAGVERAEIGAGRSASAALLAAAMLERAALDLAPQCRTRHGWKAKRRAHFRREAAWWVSAGHETPASFRWCCAVLGIDPARTRARLLGGHFAPPSGGWWRAADKRAAA